jgi:hypothetical protein
MFFKSAIFLFVINIVEIYPEDLQEQMRYTSALFYVNGVGENIDKIVGTYAIMVGYYSDGKPDTFYAQGYKYLEFPLADYYIFDYIYDTIPDGKDGLEVIKVIKDVRVFDNNESLDDLENIPYTSPRLWIRNVIEHNLFFNGVALSYIRIDVMYHGFEKDSFYTKAFNYRNLPVSGDFMDDYIFDYVYDTIFYNSLESYGINDDLVTVKVITDIHSDPAAWPAMW